MASPVSIDHSAYPHIVTRILGFADLAAQNAFAQTCKAYYDAFDATARRHVVVRTRGDTVTIGTRIGGRHRSSITIPSMKPSRYQPGQHDAFFDFLRDGVSDAAITDVEYPAHNMLTQGRFRSPGVARVPTLRVITTARMPPPIHSRHAWTLRYPCPLSKCDSLVVFSVVNPPAYQVSSEDPDAYYFELVGFEYLKYVFNRDHRLVINIDIPPDAKRPDRNRHLVDRRPKPGQSSETRSELVMVFKTVGVHRPQAPVRDPWWEPLALTLARDIRSRCSYTFVGTNAFQPPMALGADGGITASFEEIVRGEHHKRRTVQALDDDGDPYTIESSVLNKIRFITRDQYRAEVGEEQFAIDTGV